jgi:hypothetical protein
MLLLAWFGRFISDVDFGYVGGHASAYRRNCYRDDTKYDTDGVTNGVTVGVTVETVSLWR